MARARTRTTTTAPAATTTTTATEFARVRRDENYWPKIREVIGNDGTDEQGRRVKLWLDCTICRNSMLRFPAPKFPPVRGELAPALLEKITVLYCGHVFHFTCMQAWMRASKSRSVGGGTATSPNTTNYNHTHFSARYYIFM